jgi:hypothetical protein
MGMSKLRIQDKATGFKGFRLEVEFKAKLTCSWRIGVSVLAMTTKTLFASLIFATSLFPQNSANQLGTPFKGTLQATQTITPLQDPFIYVELRGSGNATHLGRFSLYGAHVANTATATGVGTYMFTAASGDTLTASFTSTVAPVPDTQNQQLMVVEYAVITGGTGRFAGATGTFQVDRIFSFVTLSTSGTFDGRIILAK